MPKEYKVSPWYIPVLMFGFLGHRAGRDLPATTSGVLPGDTKNSYLLVGLGFILAGIMTATQYR